MIGTGAPRPSQVIRSPLDDGETKTALERLRSEEEDEGRSKEAMRRALSASVAAFASQPADLYRLPQGARGPGPGTPSKPPLEAKAPLELRAVPPRPTAANGPPAPAFAEVAAESALPLARAPQRRTTQSGDGEKGEEARGEPEPSAAGSARSRRARGLLGRLFGKPSR